MKQLIRNNRLIDAKPEGNSQWLCPSQEIIRSVQVRIAGITAGRTMEESFISDATLSTTGAVLGSVCWTDSHKTMPRPECFILYKLPQLESAPIRDDSVEPSSPVAFSYSCQIFHNKEGSDFCFAYDVLADDVVLVPSKPFLPATQHLKMLFGRLCASTLKPRFELPEPIDMTHSSFEEMSLARYSDVVYAEVNADNVFDRANVSIDLFSNTKMKKEFSSPHEQFAFGHLPISVFGEVSRNGYGHLHPSVKCGNAQNAVLDGETSWRIIPYASIEDGLGLCLLAALISPLDCSSNQLGLKIGKLSSHLSVNGIVELEIRLVRFPARVDGIIDCFRIDRKGLPDDEAISKFNLYCGSVIHKGMNDGQIFKPFGNEENSGWQFIPRLKSWASLPYAS